jgi:hypothetical protein
MASGGMKAISPYLRCSEPLPSFLQGSLIWITQWQEFIDGEWRSFTSVPQAGTIGLSISQ